MFKRKHKVVTPFEYGSDTLHGQKPAPLKLLPQKSLVLAALIGEPP